MKKTLDYSAFERISSNMARDFGSIKKGMEEDYDLQMFPIEGNLIKMKRKYVINNGRRVIEAIKISLHIINGYINKIEYDLSKYITDENKNYVTAVLMAVDPFTNDKIQMLIQKMYNLNSEDDLRMYFTVPIKCLLRIEKSVQLWTDKMGITGYFNFIEEQLGASVKKDDEMDFIIDIKE